MVDKNKVLKGLEMCSIAYNESDSHCRNCPYESTENAICGELLCADARALLKEQDGKIACRDEDIKNLKNIINELKTMINKQKPRLLTLEEAIGEEDPIWFESVGNAQFWVNIDYSNDFCGTGYDFLSIDRFHAQAMCLSSKLYGKTWRCWSAKPTDEQRKEMLWE